MEFLKEWVTNIILFILLATVIDMLLPNSNMQKYTKVVVGLLLIVIILTPVLKLLSSNFEDSLLTSFPKHTANEEKNMKTLIDLKKKEIQASQHAYILETMAVQLKKDAAEELMEQYELTIANINLEVDEGSKKSFPQNLQKVTVLLQQPAEETAAVEAVQTIDINTEAPLSSKTETNQTQLITTFLSDKWNVNEETIEVSIEGELDKNDG